MKKIILPVLLVILIGALVMPTLVRAQKDDLDCNEWKRLAGSEDCRYWTFYVKSSPGLWCADTREELWRFTDQGMEPQFEFESRPPDYTYSFDPETCILTEENLKHNSSQVYPGDLPGIGGSLENDPETGQGVIDWAKGLLEKPEAPDLYLKEPQLPFVEKWMSVEFRERAERATNEVNDWIIENVGVYEPSIADFNKAPLQNREPQIKRDRPPADSPLRQMIEEELAAGGIVSNYDDGVLVESLYRGSWLYFSPTAVVRYSPELGRRIFEVRKGETEIKTEENTLEVETPDATIKSKGTHYWVAYDPDQKTTTVGVYEGEVEVTPKGGKPVSLVPDGGKPGVVVVSQKLSVFKLIIAVVIIVAVAVGIYWVKSVNSQASLIKRKKRR